MRKVFQHQYIVGFLALMALTLTLVTISLSKIEDYNLIVRNEQKKLRTEADGTTDREISFSQGYGYIEHRDHPLFYVEISLFLSLFLSLLLSQRITFSLLSAFLFFFQSITFYNLFFGSNTFDFGIDVYNNLYNASIPQRFFVSSIFIVFLLTLSYWQSSIICRFFSLVYSGVKSSDNI